MVINLEAWYKLPKDPIKNDKQLLDYMEYDKAYTTTDIQKYLKIEHPATLQRLKKLEKKGFVEKRWDKRRHLWRKLKDWPEEEPEMKIAGGSMIVK